MDLISSIEFSGSFVHYNDCPVSKLPEFAFIGRSNVGKSSLINMLTNHERIAKVSNTPGKTQTINYFLVNKQWYMVDLPGYGYAKVSKKLRKSWSKMIEDFLKNREQLVLLFILIDSRVAPQQLDLDFIAFCGTQRIPFAIVYTKSDKLNKKKLQYHVLDFQEAMLKSWHSMPPEFVTSAQNKTGRLELLKYISSLNATNE
ncbi:MAG TPA: ribosome biogenesis GTP-binding protein YihA/YsxC [Saprospiraceae bacterium]|nr:ribosome biogenesis GTP-binding protein YihA/YsxC [Saprospiraceae bacterium]HQW54646.1 ribosome biogenesis GTP-binding protein YihA/YsxC [Saprospiraceae bacterium]